MPDHHVLWFDISMDNARGVCSRERAGHLRGYLQRLTEAERTFRLALAQRLSLDKLSSNEMSRSRFVNLVNRDDVRMVQCRSSLGFLHKPTHAIRMSSNLSGQNLKSNFAIQFRILRQIDFAHSARADL